MQTQTEEKFVSDSDLPLFDIKLLDPSQNYALGAVGARFSGKTKLLSWLYEMWIKLVFDMIIIFSDNPQAEAYDWIPEKQRKFVYPQFCSQIVRDLDTFQHETKNALRIMIMFDDCSSRRGNKYDDALQQLFIRGRNINTSIIFSTQSSNFINSDSRGNLDWFFLLKQNTGKKKEIVAQEFLWHVVPLSEEEKKTKKKRLDSIVKWVDQRTADHNILCVDFRNGDLLYKFKVPENFVKTKKRKEKPANEDSDSSDDEKFLKITNKRKKK